MTPYLRLFLAILILFSASCSHTLKPVEYVHYVEDVKNGLHPIQEKQPYVFSLQYKPLDYVALEELRQAEVSSEELKKEIKSFGAMQYFTFRISTTDSTKDALKVNKASDKESTERQNYFDFYIQRDLKLIEGSDTLPCRLCHCVRGNGLTPYNDFVLAFDHPKKVVNGDLTFIYEDKILKTGTVTFLIAQSSINHIPQLKTD